MTELPNRIAFAGADVVSREFWLSRNLESEDVGFCYVQYVNIIPQTSTVRCFVVLPVNFEIGPLSCGSLQKQRNNMSLRPVMLADYSSRAAGIKVAKRQHRPAVGSGVPIESTLQGQLCLAI